MVRIQRDSIFNMLTVKSSEAISKMLTVRIQISRCTTSLRNFPRRSGTFVCRKSLYLSMKQTRLQQNKQVWRDNHARYLLLKILASRPAKYLNKTRQNTQVPARFYIDVRSQDGKFYKSTSLECIRHGLNRFLKSPLHHSWSRIQLTLMHMTVLKLQ